MAWNVKVAYGWFDERTPKEVLTERNILQVCDAPAAFSTPADSNLSGVMGVGTYPVHTTTSGVEAAAATIAPLLGFFEMLEQPGTDVASLIFINFKPDLFSSKLTPRPEGKAIRASDMAIGIREFLRVVSESLHSVASMWSLCEWAMLTFVRIPDDHA